MKKLLLLGATGNTGKLVAKYLLEMTDCKVILGARNNSRLIELSNVLQLVSSEDRISYVAIDAMNLVSLRNSFSRIDMVVVCSPSLNVYRNVIDTAIETEIDYFDINISAAKNEYLFSQNNEIKSKGLCFVTDGGFHPGVPAAMINYASSKFDILTKANIYGLLKMNWGDYNFSKETVLEMVSEMEDFRTLVYKNGKWLKAKFSEVVKTSFPEPYGITNCYPMHLDEMLELPEKYKSLNETAFYVSGFNTIVDNLILPPTYLTLKLFGKFAIKPLASLFQWSLKKYSKPPYNIILKLEAFGKSNGENRKFNMILQHRDGYEMTAIPIVAFLLQYLDGTARKPGVHFQANIVEPVNFFKSISELGIEIIENMN